MRYDEFRDQLQDALHAAGLHIHSLGGPTETIDLSGPERHWEMYALGSSPPGTEPFHLSVMIAFDWSPFDAARAFTCEEDLLMELLGRRQRIPRTAQRFVRVDLELRAALPYGSTATMPDAQTLGAWTASVNQKLDKLLTEYKEHQGQLVAVLGGVEPVKFQSRCDAGGVLSLQGVSATGLHLVRLPRVWDDPDRRRAEKGATQELTRLAQLFRIALDEWTVSITELARWIRYAPPPPEAKPVEPWFEDLEEEDDKGPESIH